MAIGGAVNGEVGRTYGGRMTPFLFVSCVMAAMGGLLFGYDLGVSGGVTSMEPFLKKFFPEVYRKMKEVDSSTTVSNYCIFDSQLLTTFTSSLYLAGLVASFFASSVTRTFGRRWSMLFAGVTFLAGAALGGAALNLPMLILARVLLGIGIGFANQSVPLYMSEVSPPKYRGAITSGFNCCTGIGVLGANLLNYGTQKIKSGYGWRISLAMAAVPAFLFTVGAFLLPETPNSLIQREADHGRALAVLQKFRGATADVEAELRDLIKASSVSKTVKHPFRNILRRRYRPQLVMAVAVPFFQQVTGINVITFYAPLLFRTIGLGESASLMSAVVTGVVGAGAVIVSMSLVDRLGRRVLFFAGGVVMLVSEVVVGGVLAAQLGDHGGLSRGFAYLVLVSVSMYLLGFGCSWGPLGWLVPAEIFPLEIRSAGQSITVAVGFVFIFIGAQSFLTMLCHLKSGMFFMFSGWIAVMTVFVHLLLPETKNVPIEQMEQVWKNHWFWSKLVAVEEGRNREVDESVLQS